jgi:hypothetical protein
VACDEVSSTVLVLNVTLAGAAAAAALTRAEPGEPVWLTARAMRGQWAPAGLTVVRVCENPAVVEAAADAHRAACSPLVCTYGRPSQAAWTLLRGLAASGVQLLVTADRDAAGRRFLSDLLALPGASAWLPAVAGVYEEDRLEALLADLSPGTDQAT